MRPRALIEEELLLQGSEFWSYVPCIRVPVEIESFQSFGWWHLAFLPLGGHAHLIPGHEGHRPALLVTGRFASIYSLLGQHLWNPSDLNFSIPELLSSTDMKIVLNPGTSFEDAFKFSQDPVWQEAWQTRIQPFIHTYSKDLLVDRIMSEPDFALYDNFFSVR